MARLTGLYKRSDGEPYVIWEDDDGRLHVTDGIFDVTDPKRVRDYLIMLRRVPAINRLQMLERLERYLPTSPVIGLLKGGRRHE